MSPELALELVAPLLRGDLQRRPGTLPQDLALRTRWHIERDEDGARFRLTRPDGASGQEPLSVVLDSALVEQLSALGDEAQPYLEFLTAFQNRRLTEAAFLAQAQALFIDRPAFQASLADALGRGGSAALSGLAISGMADGTVPDPTLLGEISDTLTDTSPLKGEELRAALTDAFREAYQAFTDDGVSFDDALRPVQIFMLAGDEGRREELARLFGELVFDLTLGAGADAIRLSGDAAVFWAARAAQPIV